MKKQAVKSVTSFAVVLMVLSIIPCSAFALENGTSENQTNSKNENGFGKMVLGGMRHGGAGQDGMHGMVFGPDENITEENFTEVQAEMLDSITEKIAELQSMYNNVSEATTAEELQEVLLAERQADGRGPDGMNMGPCGMNQGPCGMPGLFGLAQVENVTDDNYTEVQAEMVDALGNMTYMLNSQLDNTTDENMTEMLNEQITELETLSNEISGASSAEELKDVVFTYVQTQAVDSLEKEMEFLNARIAEDENTTDEQLEQRVTELTALIVDIEGAESLDDLKEIMSSEMKYKNGPMQEGKDPMHQGGCGNMPRNPERMQNDSNEV